ncbi:MAG TPA: hypothetical protein VEL47_03080 [Myxococcota bacterium]|nr:hypothetical protein [Myxococcota bacterium]
MNRNSLGRFLASSLIVLLITNFAFAGGKRTCADILRHNYNISVGLSIGVPVVGWMIGILNAADLVEKHQDLGRLEAATNITRGLRSRSELAEAHEVIERFYQTLGFKYPDMKLSEEELIFLLHRYNVNSVALRRCGESLIKSLFPDDKVSEYMKQEKCWLTERQLQLQQKQTAKEKTEYERMRERRREHGKCDVVNNQ